MPDELRISASNNTLRNIARNNFNLSGTGARAREAAAIEALVRANPHLSANAEVPAGAVIVIPEVTGVERQPGTLDTGSSVETDTDRRAELKRMQEAVVDVGKELLEDLKLRGLAEKETLSLIEKHRDELIKIDARMRERLQETAKDAQARLDSMSDKNKQAKQSLKELNTGFAELAKALEAGGPVLRTP